MYEGLFDDVDDILSNDVTLGPTSILAANEIETTGNASFNMSTFDYSYLTDQLKTIIDKVCKKYKIK